jgi:hypothetical protein
MCELNCYKKFQLTSKYNTVSITWPLSPIIIIIIIIIIITQVVES